MADRHARTRNEARRESAGALPRGRVVPRSGARPTLDGTSDAMLARVRTTAGNDCVSVSAMTAFPDAAVRTGHLSALVRDLEETDATD